MTSILYDGKALHGDKRMVLATCPSIIRMDGIKLFKSNCGQMAAGFSGTLLGEEEIQTRFFPMILTVLEKFATNKNTDHCFVQTLKGVEPAFSVLERECIVITRETALVLHEWDANEGRGGRPDYVHTITNQTGIPLGLGTGGRYALGAYHVSKDVEKAYSVASTLDYLTGSAFDTIRHTDLKPLVIK